MSESPGIPPLDALNQSLFGNLPQSVDEMRELLNTYAAMLNAGMPTVGATHDAVAVEGSAEGVTADVIVPEGEGPWPVLVYLHGGGWICGNPSTHRKLAHRFAEAGYLVFNVDYRLAPEHPFPTPFDDCIEAIRWAARVAHQYGGDATRLAVGGDSAGGNLSAAAAIALADDPEVQISAALLIYGVFDFARMDTLAFEGPGLNAELADAGANLIELMVGSYLGADRSAELLRDPRVSPLHGADRLPPSLVLCGEADALAPQAEELARSLERSGKPHEYLTFANMPHGFVQMEFFPQARECIERMTNFLDRQLR